MQVVGKKRLPRKWMWALGCGWGHNIHKHRAPWEATQTEEGRVVGEVVTGGGDVSAEPCSTWRTWPGKAQIDSVLKA